MSLIVIEGQPPYDGRHPFEFDPYLFTVQEWGWIKRLAGYLPLNWWDGLEGGDAELGCVLACIALHREGRVETERLPDVFKQLARTATQTTIRFEIDPAEESADADGPPAGNDSSSTSSSSDGSTTSSDTSTGPPPASGNPDSDTSESDRLRSVS